MPDNARPVASDALGQMSQAEFIEAWRTIVGEPPALILPSRSEMIEILIESTVLPKGELAEIKNRTATGAGTKVRVHPASP